jgi:hypothetical protein
MPVLTAPFIPIAKTELPGKISAGEQKIYPELYPPGYSISTELALTPRTTETWSVEGLSLSFSFAYDLSYFVYHKEVYELLAARRKLLEERLPFLATQLIAKEAQLTAAENAHRIAGEIQEKEGSLQHAKEAYEALAAVEAIKGEIASLKAEEKNAEAEIRAVAREIEELSRKEAQEGVRQPAISLILRLYVRGNELLFNRVLSSQRSFTVYREGYGEGNASQGASVGETVESHEQFDDPLDITERENLRLTLQIVGPPAPSGINHGTGPEIVAEEPGKGPMLSAVYANISYSRSVNGAPA